MINAAIQKTEAAKVVSNIEMEQKLIFGFLVRISRIGPFACDQWMVFAASPGRDQFANSLSRIGRRIVPGGARDQSRERLVISSILSR